MNKLHMRVTNKAVAVQDMAGKKILAWELDSTGKVRNYSAQFHARYKQLTEEAGGYLNENLC